MPDIDVFCLLLTLFQHPVLIISGKEAVPMQQTPMGSFPLPETISRIVKNLPLGNEQRERVTE
jgi:hypothetical protein